MKRFTRRLGLGVLLAALASTVAPTVAAQSCFGPDGLSGPCCTPVAPTLPTFPPIVIDGSAIRWNNCTPTPKQFYTFDVTPPVSIACGVYASTLTALDASGLAFASGPLELTYSRTWDEVDPSGLVWQVYRFVALAEITAVASSGPNFPNDPPSYYYGYVDWAVRCNTPPPLLWSNAIVLYHACDDFNHRPGLSAMPGVFHPTETFALVAPDNTTQPFDHTSIAPPLAGVAVVGELRNQAPGGAPCLARERMTQAQVLPIVSGCACPLSSTLPPRNTATNLTGASFCGSSFLSFDTTPVLPWLELIGTSLGRWTAPGVYPGPEAAHVYEGPTLRVDPCAAVLVAQINYGGATAGGWTRVTFPPGPVGQTLLDLTTNWSVTLPIVPPLPLPLMGAILPSPARRHALYLDLP